jgi:hypothetical protein
MGPDRCPRVCAGPANTASQPAFCVNSGTNVSRVSTAMQVLPACTVARYAIAASSCPPMTGVPMATVAAAGDVAGACCVCAMLRCLPPSLGCVGLLGPTNVGDGKFEELLVLARLCFVLADCALQCSRANVDSPQQQAGYKCLLDLACKESRTCLTHTLGSLLPTTGETNCLALQVQ